MKQSLGRLSVCNLMKVPPNKPYLPPLWVAVVDSGRSVLSYLHIGPGLPLMALPWPRQSWETAEINADTG